MFVRIIMRGYVESGERDHMSIVGHIVPMNITSVNSLRFSTVCTISFTAI